MITQGSAITLCAVLVVDVFNFVQLALVSLMLHFNNKDTSPEFLTVVEQVKRAVIINVANGGLC